MPVLTNIQKSLYFNHKTPLFLEIKKFKMMWLHVVELQFNAFKLRK